MHEHNHLADRITQEFPPSDNEQIYQLARKIVGPELQIITYSEFLPALLGPYVPTLSGYAGWDIAADPGMTTESIRSHGKVECIFDAIPDRLSFAGHYHKWLLVTPEGIKGWEDEGAVRLDEGVTSSSSVRCARGGTPFSIRIPGN